MSAPAAVTPTGVEVRSPFRIAGLGSALPVQRVSNHDLAAHLDTTDEWVRSRSGIVARRRAGPAETTTRLAADALARALDDGGLGADALDLVIVATSTPDSACPATAARVADALGSPAAGFDLNGACCGFVHALQVGAALLDGAGPATVAVVGADRYTTLVDPTDRATAVLFGDGAAAAVLRRSDRGDGCGLLGSDAGGDPRSLGVLEVPVGGGHLRMDGPGLFRLATRAMVHSSLLALSRAGLDPGDVDLFVPHQANARIISAVGDRLGIEPERTVVDVTERANTSAASIPLALEAAHAAGSLADGALVLLSGVGAGLGWASAVVRWGR